MNGHEDNLNINFITKADVNLKVSTHPTRKEHYKAPPVEYNHDGIYPRDEKQVSSQNRLEPTIDLISAYPAKDAD